MTVAFKEQGGQVESITADQDVAITNTADGSRATGERAIYTAADGMVRLTGHPEWRSATQTGRADQLRFETRTRSIRADGHVAMSLIGAGTHQGPPGLALFAFTTLAPAAPQPVQISARHLNFKGSRAVFRGQVRVATQSATLGCHALTVTLAEPGNRFRVISATGHVDAREGDDTLACEQLTAHYHDNGQLADLVAEHSVEILTRQGTNRVDAIGSRAVYTAATRRLELTGQALLQTAQLTSRGEALVWDQTRRSLRMKGFRHAVFNRAAPVVPGQRRRTTHGVP